jgi:hypothetical protein
VNSFIVPPELTANGREITVLDQVGSGPFRFVEWNEGVFGSVSRNPNWHGGSGRPYLDGVTAIQPRDASTVEAGLRTKQLDVAFVGSPTANRLRAVIPSLIERPMGTSSSWGCASSSSRRRTPTRACAALFHRAQPPRDGAGVFAGSGDINPWISWPVKRWTPPQSELQAIPGYRPGDGGRAQDIVDARAMLAAVPAPVPSN